jgi:hypothetical protein
VSGDDETTCLVRCRIDDLEATITAWSALDGAVAEARLFPLTGCIGDVHAGALLTERAPWERASGRTDRRAVVTQLYALRHLADQGPRRGIYAQGTTQSNDLMTCSKARW